MINIFNLNKARRNRYNKQKHIYKIVLKKCHHKIINSGNSFLTNCIFTIPQYLPGMPLFNIAECMRYLIYKLEKNEFNVKVYSENTLNISWEHIPLYQEVGKKKKKKKKKKVNKYREIKESPLYNLNQYNKFVE